MIEHRHVGQRDWRQLQHVDMNARLRQRCKGLEYLFTLHREEGDFGIEDETAVLHSARKPLPPPDDLLQRKRNLLSGLVFDDVGNLLGLDRRQLDELREPKVARHGDSHLVALQIVATDELFEGRLNQLNGVGLRLGANLGVFDVFACHNFQLPRLGGHAATQRLQSAVADVDSPHIRNAGHGRFQKILGSPSSEIQKGIKRFPTNTL